jgi:hypothetical protein
MHNHLKRKLGKTITALSLIGFTVGGVWSSVQSSFAAPITVYATPVVGNGSNGICPGGYIGCVSYTNTTAQGWGWAPSTNTTVHTATDTNRPDTKIQYQGKLSDKDCNQTSVTIPHPPHSPKYRFFIYFTNNVPTNAYPIVLEGFNP